MTRSFSHVDIAAIMGGTTVLRRPLATAPERDRNPKEVPMSTPYVKRTIPNTARVVLAERHGVPPGGGMVGIPCFYCGREVGSASWYMNWKTKKPSTWIHFSDIEMDHFWPESRGGAEDPENLVLACRPCNRAKKDRHPVEFLTGRSMP